MTSKDLAPVLSIVGTIAETAGKTLPGIAGVVAGFVSAALKFGAEIAAAGGDPISHIERLHAADPLLATVEDGWAAAMRDKFPQD